MNRSYELSGRQLTRAERTIPLGSQTFSKSRTALPVGGAPLFATHGDGGRLWDVDGNEYVDLVCGLACVTLGYRHPAVDAAVVEQLGRGVTLSLATPLEAEVAERICELVPCAERVRFGKNGSDATSAAIRLARHHTGREHVAMCGYHGWQDWSIGTTSRSSGVPEAVRGLTSSFAYGDLEALGALLRARPTAAVILEPMNVVEPEPGHLAALVELAHAHGALAIFDETITGFRFHLGGAQALFDATPDLATFGKGLANGFPLSAVVGRAEVMAGMEEIFFSGTFGGETLSLAASRATLDTLVATDAPALLARTGATLIDGLRARVERHGAGELVAVAGHPTWAFVQLRPVEGIDPWHLRTLFLERMAANGVLTLGTHNVCAAHDERDVAQVLAAYDAVLPELVDAVERRDVRSRLRGRPLEPLFRPR